MRQSSMIQFGYCEDLELAMTDRKNGNVDISLFWCFWARANAFYFPCLAAYCNYAKSHNWWRSMGHVI